MLHSLLHSIDVYQLINNIAFILFLLMSFKMQYEDLSIFIYYHSDQLFLIDSLEWKNLELP